jgi:hypothetical protein
MSHHVGQRLRLTHALSVSGLTVGPDRLQGCCAGSLCGGEDWAAGWHMRSAAGFVGIASGDPVYY